MRVPLIGGAYQARSIIANAQRCVNLYPEINPKDAPVPVTHYPTPGLTQLVQGPSYPVRCTYRASNGDLYTVIGPNVYYSTPGFSLQQLGTIFTTSGIVSMADNGLSAVLVDGTTAGYKINLTSRNFEQINDADFYGGDRVDILDNFFILNRPGTNQFYISEALTVQFDPLDIAAKSGYPDDIVSLIVMHREIWLLGTLTTEIWYNSGAAAFPFERMPGAFIQHGCIAKHSVAQQDLSIYWLGQDPQGNRIVFRGNSYAALRISTHAIEAEFAQYAVVEDAIGYTYQQEGHAFYVLTFPAANKTWVFDQATELWHERAWLDSNGNLDRHRSNCCANAYGVNVVGDWQNGKLYAMDLDTYTDIGNPIPRIRSFPHLLNDGKRVSYSQFIADMAVGEYAGTEIGDSVPVSLRWSDTRGASWSNPVMQSLGTAGQYLTSLQWRRLGMARDRVFELSWSIPAKTALNGAFIEPQAMGT